MNVTTVGINLAKNVFQFGGVNAAGAIQFNKKVTRANLLNSLTRIAVYNNLSYYPHQKNILKVNNAIDVILTQV